MKMKTEYKCPVCEYENTIFERLLISHMFQALPYACKFCNCDVVIASIEPSDKLVNCSKTIGKYHIYYNMGDDYTVLHESYKNDADGKIINTKLACLSGFVGNLFKCTSEQEIESLLILL